VNCRTSTIDRLNRRSKIDIRQGWELLKYILLMVLIFPLGAVAGEQPDSIRLWSQLGEYFYSLSSSNEEEFKSDLKKHYVKVYDGEALTEWNAWIDKGSIESEYYSSFYGDLRDIKSEYELVNTDTEYLINANQKSCYSLGYNPPIITLLASTYKISNCSQSKINKWYEAVMTKDFLAEVCLDIKWLVRLKLETEHQKIIDEEWKVSSSNLTLISNRSSPEDTNKWCN